MPSVPFPEGCRCAVLLGLDFDGTSHEVGRGIAPLGINSWGRYPAKRGIPRHLDLLEKHGVPATFFVPGYDAEQYPAIVKEIDRRGFEVAAHGYLHEAWDLEGAEEEKLLRQTDRILHDLLGKPVRGWRSPSGRKSENTMGVLKSLGYLYDSSDKDFDLPYRIRFGKAAQDFLIELPNNTYSLDDFAFYKFSIAPPSEVLQHWQSEFDAVYRSERFFVLTIHPRSGWGSGTPGRTQALDSMIGYMKAQPGVRFFSSAQMAEWCVGQGSALEELSFA
jgi:peptidoglycan/xylan/chitin deacetylase (PgdA/CDA1 family)